MAKKVTDKQTTTTPTVMYRDAFFEAATKGAAPNEVIVRKQIAGSFEKAAAEGTTPLAGDTSEPQTRRFCISTQAVDRDNDTVAVAGWKTDNYLKNPVVLWAHDYSALPIGKCVNLSVSDGKLMGTCQFADHPMAKTVLSLVDGGYLNATSVGFKPIDYSLNQDRQGMDFKSQELLEFSIVPVPANPQALIAASADGAVDMSPMMAWAKAVLKAVVDKGVSPKDVSMTKADEGEAWSAPSLKDFTSDVWGDLSDAQKRNIAGHFAWAAAVPPDNYGDLKLPHHDAKSGDVNWRGVANAAARLGQSDIPSGDMGAVKAHLARHYKQFDKVAPWDAQADDFAAYLAATKGQPDATVKSIAAKFGFTDLAASFTKDGDDEAAENVGYSELAASIGQLDSMLARMRDAVTALIAAQAPDDDEDVEDARLEVIQSIAQQMQGALWGVSDLARNLCDDDDDQPGVTIQLAADGKTKAGRVISRANEARLKSASDHMKAASDHVTHVIQQVQQQAAAPVPENSQSGDDTEEDSASKLGGDSMPCPECGQPMNQPAGASCLHPRAHEVVVGKAADEVLLDIADEDVLDGISADDLKAAFAEALNKTVLAEAVKSELEGALARARGRVD